MQLAGRAQAACAILDEIASRRRPASIALQEWARANRFAGSGDRAAIGSLVYDALRRRASFAWIMQSERAEALVAAALRAEWGLGAEAVAALFDGSRHAPAPLTPEEGLRLLAPAPLDGAPDWVRGDYPEWLNAMFGRQFGETAAAEGAALATRAPIDLRVNTLKATRPKVLSALAKFGAEATPLSPFGVRVPARAGAARAPHVEAEPAHGKGWFEVQDEGSQIAALLSGAAPRAQLCDLCAGAGGKTLAMSAAMQNTGQIHAYDADATRLRPIFERLKRAGARNVQVLPPGDGAALDRLAGAMDGVLVDAPCSGSGVWRRKPDSKWRLTREALTDRIVEQAGILARAASLVRPGGRLAYVTCSILPEENATQANAFFADHPEFAPVPVREAWAEAIGGDCPASAANDDGPYLQLTPRMHGTDGFFIALFRRKG